MKAREYLDQAYKLDQRINSKLEQISVLNDLARKATGIITGMPHSPNHGESRVADAVEKIVDLQNEIRPVLAADRRGHGLLHRHHLPPPPEGTAAGRGGS